jgi:hypothetical protein
MNLLQSLILSMPSSLQVENTWDNYQDIFWLHCVKIHAYKDLKPEDVAGWQSTLIRILRLLKRKNSKPQTNKFWASPGQLQAWMVLPVTIFTIKSFLSDVFDEGYPGLCGNPPVLTDNVRASCQAAADYLVSPSDSLDNFKSSFR